MFLDGESTGTENQGTGTTDGESTGTENQGKIEGESTETEKRDASTGTENQEGAGGDDSDGEAGTGEDEKKFTQKQLNEIMVRKQRRLNQANEERAQLEARARELEQRLNQLTQGQRPEIPPLPDKFDPDFDAKIAARDKAIAAQQAHDYRVAIARAAQAQQAQDAQRSKQSHATQVLTEHNSRVTASGIPVAQAVNNENIVAEFVKDPDISLFLLSQPNSPALIQHLAGSPQELDTIGRMPAIEAVSYIFTKIMPGMQQATGQRTNPPEKKVGGRSTAPKKRSPLLRGAKFE